MADSGHDDAIVPALVEVCELVPQLVTEGHAGNLTPSLFAEDHGREQQTKPAWSHLSRGEFVLVQSSLEDGQPVLV